LPRTPSTQPTDGELELLQALWDSGPAELGDIHQRLSGERKVALTTVATMLTVMLAKGLVERSKGKRGWVWSASVSRESAAKPIVRKLVDRVFDGSAQRLVAHLLEHESLNAAERRELLSLLERSRERTHSPRRTEGGKSR
jgi:BlaI family transcriptional regulator, penicillinase repressor